MFPGVEFVPFARHDLNRFVLDIQRLGFTPWRKMRLLQAVGRFCQGAAIPYTLKNNADITEFTGAAWVAIQKAVNHYDPEQKGGYLTLLAFWLRAEYNAVIYGFYTTKKYQQDKLEITLESIYRKVYDHEDLELIDTIKDPNGGAELASIENKIVIDSIIQNSGLTKNERDFIKLFLTPESPNYSEIATIKNYSKEYARQLKEHSIKKLKKTVQNERNASEPNTKGVEKR